LKSLAIKCGLEKNTIIIWFVLGPMKNVNVDQTCVCVLLQILHFFDLKKKLMVIKQRLLVK
jgi:hypothetical protein